MIAIRFAQASVDEFRFVHATTGVVTRTH